MSADFVARSGIRENRCGPHRQEKKSQGSDEGEGPRTAEGRHGGLTYQTRRTFAFPWSDLPVLDAWATVARPCSANPGPISLLRRVASPYAHLLAGPNTNPRI